MTKARNNADNVSGDISEVTAGTGISVSNGTGPAPAVALTTPVASTNGGTGLSSFTTGDIIYSSSGNTLSKLGIGTTSQVLTVAGGLPSWSTPSSGGMTLLSTTTLSGATTTITISDSSYRNLFVVAYRVSNDTANGDFRFKLNSDATMMQADIYRFSSTTGTGGVGGGYINLSNGNGVLRTNNDNYWAINIYDYASASFYKAFDWRGIYVSTQSGNPNTGQFGAGGYPSNSAITSLIFENSNGNLNGGTVLVYGVK